MTWHSAEFGLKLRGALLHLGWFLRLPPDLRDEVVQDTLTALLLRDPASIDPGKHLPYAITVARHRSLLLMEREKKYERGPDEEFVSGNSPDPEQLALASERIMKLEQALSQLPELQQQVIRLVLQDGLRVADVAQRLRLREAQYTSICPGVFGPYAVKSTHETVRKWSPECSSR
jgi:RNA polymerase sigma factor (sigma-70 family)